MQINQKKLIQILTLCVILLLGYSVFITVEKNKLVNKGRLEIDGGTYIGDLVNGVRHGEGRFVDNIGRTITGGRGSYVGKWKDDRIHGKGTIKWVGGMSYEGYFKDGKRHGKGTIKWVNGDLFKGYFKDNERHGKGTFKSADGSTEEFLYQDGNRVKI